MKYTVKIYGGKVISLAIFKDEDLVIMGGLPEGFTEITEEKYNYLSENITAFKKYNSVTELLETDTEALAAMNLRNVALARAQRIKDIARQRVLVDTLTELEETNEATRQTAVLTEMKAAYAADYPAIIP
jgi:hypothetical protein